jgi:hypothetical protein
MISNLNGQSTIDKNPGPLDRTPNDHSITDQKITIENLPEEYYRGLELLDPFNRAEEYILDSIVDYFFNDETDSARLFKYIWEIQNDGQIEIYRSFYWDDENMMWIKSLKVDYYIRDGYDLDSMFSYNWNTEQNEWVHDTRRYYGYDQNEYWNHYESLYWNTDLNRWDKGFKHAYQNDEYGNVLEDIRWTDDENNEWQLYGKEVRTYDADLKLISIIDYDWELNEWVYVYKYEHFYLENGLQDYRLYSRFNEDEWDLEEKDEYIYNDQDQLIKLTSSELNDGDWINDSKVEYAYDDNGYEILSVRSFWNPGEESWEFYNKDEHAYNALGRITLFAIYYWSDEFNDWEGYLKRDYFFNELNLKIRQHNSIWDDETFDWVLEVKGYYYWSIITGVVPVAAHDLKVYPNPAKDFVTVAFEQTEAFEVSIISMSGQVLRKYRTTDKAFRIDLQGLPRGIYLLQIKKGIDVITKRIVKE